MTNIEQHERLTKPLSWGSFLKENLNQAYIALNSPKESLPLDPTVSSFMDTFSGQYRESLIKIFPQAQTIVSAFFAKPEAPASAIILARDVDTTPTTIQLPVIADDEGFRFKAVEYDLSLINIRAQVFAKNLEGGPKIPVVPSQAVPEVLFTLVDMLPLNAQKILKYKAKLEAKLHYYDIYTGENVAEIREILRNYIHVYDRIWSTMFSVTIGTAWYDEKAQNPASVTGKGKIIFTPIFNTRMTRMLDDAGERDRLFLQYGNIPNVYYSDLLSHTVFSHGRQIEPLVKLEDKLTAIFNVAAGNSSPRQHHITVV